MGWSSASILDPILANVILSFSSLSPMPNTRLAFIPIVMMLLDRITNPSTFLSINHGSKMLNLDSSIPNIFNYSEISEPIQPVLSVRKPAVTGQPGRWRKSSTQNLWHDSVRKALVYSSHRLKLEDEIGATASRFPVIYLTDHPISRTLHQICSQETRKNKTICTHPAITRSSFLSGPVETESFAPVSNGADGYCRYVSTEQGDMWHSIHPSGGRKTGFGLRRFLKNRSETFTYSFGSCKAFTVRYFLPLSLLLLRNPTGLTRIPSPGANSRRSAGFRSIGDQISLSRRGKPRCLCFLRRKTTTFRRFLQVPFSGSLDRSIVVWHLRFRSFSFVLGGMQTMEAGLCSARTPSSQEESGDEELSVLPRHTKVIVTGNNRTKSVLVGLQGVVKKAVGLGGWHWLVLKNGVEVKLQRNALSVLEAPTGNEDDDDDIDCDNSFCSSSDMGDKDVDYSSLEFHKPTKPRVRHTRPWTSSAKSNGRGNHRDTHTNGHKPQMRLNLAKLGTPALWRYWRHFNLVNINPNPTKEQLIHGVQNHLLSQQLDEMQVIVGFIHTAKRLKTLYS
ncbi:unnamed protein product [Musa hybrid cultivar]